MRYYYLLIISFLLFLCIYSCTQEKKLFTEIESSDSGITFNNVVEHNDSLNILKFEYIYNGGGVAIADFNNDGLQDVLFTGNIVDNALYLNKGDFKFDDVSVVSNVSKANRWSTGVTVADINTDGLLDLFITSSGYDLIEDRSNQLLICTGIDDEGIPKYRDETFAYGLKDSSYSTHSAFLDYDNDGDLDLIVINNNMVEDRSPSKYRQRNHNERTTRTDQLFQNNWDESVGHPVFKDVSHEAGITKEGFSLGVNIHDFNEDGWSDIFITNDYLSTDLLYINQQDGTFKDEADIYFKHTSFSAMGNDVIDLDNDGHAEVVALDMLPDDNYRKKTMLPGNNYTSYINNEKYNYQYQHVRNTLQKNNFSTEHAGRGPIFSEQALISGIAATDWSWTPLVADFDNDGDRDMIVTNGFPQDVTDRDFIDYNVMAAPYATEVQILANVPSIKIPNVAFRNEGNLSFQKVNKVWGITASTFSNGAAYADLDNDGDLDYVVNNINDVASLFRNNSEPSKNWLRIKLKGPQNNPGAYGAIITVESDSLVQKITHTPNHGYLSSVEPIAHFGLGQTASNTSIYVHWPDNTLSVLVDVAHDQLMTIDYANSKKEKIEDLKYNVDSKLMIDVTRKRGLDYTHHETDYNDFNVQPMLLHKLSQYGPGLAVGDINGDDMEDFYISGSHFVDGTFYIQNESGQYERESLFENSTRDEPGEELGVLLFDADGDGDNDLYTAMGGYEYDLVDSIYQDRIYINQNGKFKLAANALPAMITSSSIVRAVDYDKDGDPDLFVGGRQLPGEFPLPASSYILRNDSSEGLISYTEVSNEVAVGLSNIGMVTDALWTDYDNDGAIDLILTGEFMPITILHNKDGKFINKTEESGLSNHIGWWNSIVGGDFDRDGDVDYIVGNYGDHSLTSVNEEHPIKVYYKDFDDNGSKDLIPTCFYDNGEGEKAEYTYFGRLELEKQLIRFKGNFRKHADFAKASIDEIFTEEDLDSCVILQANYMKTSYVENLGGGDFNISALPALTQVAPIYGMEVLDADNDGYLDVLMIGNDHGMEVSIGRLDAHDGLVLYGHGDGTFSAKHASETGFYVQGDGKSIVQIFNQKKNALDILVSQNKDSLKVFSLYEGDQTRMINFQPNDAFAVIYYHDERKEKRENNLGSTYLAQSTRKFNVPFGATKCIITTVQGIEREVTF